jgi:hypothetical protein
MKGTRMNTQHVRQTNEDPGTGRIEAFSDGVIAVAITLLILDVHVPSVQTNLLRALLTAWPTYLPRRAKRLSHITSSFLDQEGNTRNAETTPALTSR